MKKLQNKKGFTMAELLIVVAIIAVLVAISIPIFSAQLEKSRDATTLANLRNAYAEASAQYLTDGSSNAITKTVKYSGTEAGGINAGDLSFTISADDIKKIDGTTKGPDTKSVTFTFTSGTSGTGSCTATIS